MGGSGHLQRNLVLQRHDDFHEQFHGEAVFAEVGDAGDSRPRRSDPLGDVLMRELGFGNALGRLLIELGFQFHYGGLSVIQTKISG